MGDDHESRSRRINALLGGDPAEMFCSRAWRLQLFPVWIALNVWFMLRHRESWGHCERIFLREGAFRPWDPDSRYRRSEGDQFFRNYVEESDLFMLSERSDRPI